MTDKTALDTEADLEEFKKIVRECRIAEVNKIKNEMYNTPDLDFWCVLQRWKFLQAIALITEINPWNINQGTYNIFIGHFTEPIFYEFIKRESVLLSDIKYKEILANTQDIKDKDLIELKPIDVINWAKKRGFSVPKEVEERVRENNKENVDWESKYKELEDENVKLKSTIESINQKPLQHHKEKALKRMIVMFLVLYYETKHGSEINMVKMSETVNANNLLETAFSTINFKKYGEFTPLKQDAFTDHFKDVREMLGFTPTCNNKKPKNQ